MAFTEINMTEKGIAALNKAQSGLNLQFTKAVIGDGKQTNVEVEEMINGLFSLPISGKSVNAKSCTLEIDLNNTMYQQDYYFRELGIFAECDGTEVLYAYANAGDEADLIPSGGTFARVERRLRISLQISNASNITIAGESVLYVLQQEFEAEVSKKADKENPVFTSSLSMGRKSGTTVGSNSTALGSSCEANGNSSNAEGYNTVAAGDYSHAEGRYSQSNGLQSHAEGFSTTATGSASHSEGQSTTAGGNYSHSEGYSTEASGNYSHVEGAYSVATKDAAHAEGGGTEATGNSSHAEGSGTKATGTASHSEGSSTTASGEASHSEGGSTKALGTYSHAEGGSTTANASYDHTEGYSSITDSTASTGTARHAEGYLTTASGEGAHSEGKWTSASGTGAHAEGSGSSASTLTVASGTASHAEGYRTSASANYSHAEGQSTTASGIGAHAEGYSTKAAGQYSHAEGYSATASGYGSHAEGYGTTALTYQHAAGHYNDTSLATAASSSGTTGTLFVLGNGTSSSAVNNAMRVTGEGAVIAKAAYQSTGADYAEWQEWSDGNPNDEDRRGYFVVFEGDKIRKATSADRDVVGVVSANPCVIGNNDDGWRGKFLMDEFGDYIYEEVEVEREEIDPETGETITVKELTTTYKVNPDYDPDMEYVHRKDRKEWDCIGFMGMLMTRSDGTCEVNKRCKPNDNGEATLSDDGNGYLVLNINEETQLVKVLIGVNVRNW